MFKRSVNLFSVDTEKNNKVAIVSKYSKNVLAVPLNQWFSTFFIHRPILQSDITKRPPSMQINKND